MRAAQGLFAPSDCVCLLAELSNGKCGVWTLPHMWAGSLWPFLSPILTMSRTAATNSTFAGDKSMRVNYEQGVDHYYQATGAEYRNPHFAGIVTACQAVMEAWWAAAQHQGLAQVRVLDLACGSGEATQAVEYWWQLRTRGGRTDPASRRPAAQRPQQAGPPAEPAAAVDSGSPAEQAVVPQAPEPGADSPSRSASGAAEGVAGPSAATPSSPSPPASSSATTTVQGSQTAPGAPVDQLDRGSQGGGEGGPLDREVGPGAVDAASPGLPQLVMEACDPYTYGAFERWTGRPAERWTFQDVADGCLADRSYDICISSYALHVLDDSKLFSTLLQLSLVTAHLIVLSPHKKPHIGTHMGWHLQQHLVVERVHAWLYESTNFMR